jgi:hypothetical protein
MGNAKLDDKAVFDGGVFSGPAADKDKGDRATAEGSFETKWVQQRSAELATWRSVEGFEEKWANGFTKVDGRHAPADGIVSRRGYRRIIPDSGPGREWFEDRAEDLANIAKEVLRGRNATVFEGRVLNPLMGRPKRSIEELAEQFGRPTKRIYKILDECRDQIAAYRRRKPLADDAKRFRPAHVEYFDYRYLGDIDERPGFRYPVVFCGVREGYDVYADLLPQTVGAPRLGTHWYVRRK